MPDRPVSLPIPTAALADALGVAAGQGDAMSSNRMLRILRAAAPEMYKAWGERLVEPVAMQLAAVAGDDCFTMALEMPGQAEQNSVGREAWKRQAREVIGLDGESGRT